LKRLKAILWMLAVALPLGALVADAYLESLVVDRVLMDCALASLVGLYFISLVRSIRSHRRKVELLKLHFVRIPVVALAYIAFLFAAFYASSYVWGMPVLS